MERVFTECLSQERFRLLCCHTFQFTFTENTGLNLVNTFAAKFFYFGGCWGFLFVCLFFVLTTSMHKHVQFIKHNISAEEKNL